MYYEEPKMEVLAIDGNVFTDLINGGSVDAFEGGPDYGFEDWT